MPFRYVNGAPLIADQLHVNACYYHVIAQYINTFSNI